MADRHQHVLRAPEQARLVVVHGEVRRRAGLADQPADLGAPHELVREAEVACHGPRLGHHLRHARVELPARPSETAATDRAGRTRRPARTSASRPAGSATPTPSAARSAPNSWRTPDRSSRDRGSRRRCRSAPAGTRGRWPSCRSAASRNRRPRRRSRSPAVWGQTKSSEPSRSDPNFARSGRKGSVTLRFGSDVFNLAVARSLIGPFDQWHVDTLQRSRP